jgi:hypothetical protein
MSTATVSPLSALKRPVSRLTGKVCTETHLSDSALSGVVNEFVAENGDSVSGQDRSYNQ